MDIERVNALEVKVATMEATQINLSEDIHALTDAVSRQNEKIDKLTERTGALTSEVSKGKGVAIGIVSVAGAAYMVVRNFFT